MSEKPVIQEVWLEARGEMSDQVASDRVSDGVWYRVWEQIPEELVQISFRIRQQLLSDSEKELEV